VAAFVSTPAAAQGLAPEPPGPYVIDLRGTMSGLPGGAELLSSPTAATTESMRGMGVDLGAHAYVGRFGASRIGVGASVLMARGTESPSAPANSSTKPEAVQVTLRSIVPQVSFNFGTKAGWSYLSTGVGVSAVRFTGTSAAAIPRSIDRVTTINMGGGARWFVRERVGFGFDLRFYRLAGRDLIPASTRLSLAAGVSLR
jgi:hypothetical protein